MRCQLSGEAYGFPFFPLSKELSKRKHAKIRSSGKKGGLPAQIPAYSVELFRCPLRRLLEQGIKGNRHLGKDDVGTEQSARPGLGVTRLCRLPETEMTLERSQAPHTLLGPSLSELVTRREAPCKQETVNCPGWASRGNGEKHIYHAKELRPENFL